MFVFFIINLAPGGPVEQKLAQLQFSGAFTSSSGSHTSAISEEVIQSLKKQYGFDKPVMFGIGYGLKALSPLILEKALLMKNR